MIMSPRITGLLSARDGAAPRSTAAPRLVQQILARGSGKTASPFVKAQDAVDPALGPPVRPIDPGSQASGRVIDDAGLFGAGAILPTDGGPVEPDPLNMTPLEGPTPEPTRDAGAPYSPGTSAMFGPISGEHWLGGRIVGMDPNTNKPVYDPNGYGDMEDLGGVQYSGVARVGAGTGVASGNPWTVASKRSGHSGNWWVF